jgi:hypothetical protein
MCRTEVGESASVLGPEGFERKAEWLAENRGATIEAFVNKENDEKISKGLLGTGTQMPSPFPDHFSC